MQIKEDSGVRSGHVCVCMCVAAGEVGDVIKAVSRDVSPYKELGLERSVFTWNLGNRLCRAFHGCSQETCLSERGTGRTEQMKTAMQMQLKLQQVLLELWSWRTLQNHAALRAGYQEFVSFHHLSLARARPWEGPYLWVRQFPVFDNSQ